MSYVAESGIGIGGYENVLRQSGTPAFATTGTLTASGTLVSVVGRVIIPNLATSFDIRRVHFRCGSVAFASTSSITFSLQNVTATAGPPYQPDGTQDQTYVFTGSTAFTASSANNTGNLSADRTVAPGEFVAAVWQYASFSVSDAVVISAGDRSVTPPFYNAGGSALINTAGTWALQSNVPMGIIAFENAAGNFAGFQSCYPYSAYTTVNVSTATTARAAGVAFVPATKRQMSGFSLLVNLPNGSDGELRLIDTDGTTVLGSMPIDNDAVAAAAVRWMDATFAPVTLSTTTATAPYRAIFEPTTTTAATVTYGDVSASGMLAITVGGENAVYTQRDSGAAWAETATRRAFWNPNYAAFDDGAGGSGGLLVHPGLSGGARG